jgi:hypothetical protein
LRSRSRSRGRGKRSPNTVSVAASGVIWRFGEPGSLRRWRGSFLFRQTDESAAWWAKTFMGKRAVGGAISPGKKLRIFTLQAGGAGSETEAETMQTVTIRNAPITAVSRENLVLSVFPGADLLGRGFEQEGFCVVRGPDLVWGGDVRTFHPPPGAFGGV